MKIFIDKFCGNTDPRLADQHITAGTCGKRTEFITDSLSQSGPPQKAVRDVCPYLYPSLHQFFYGKSQAEKAVNADHRRSRIRASPCHACGNRDKFLQLYPDPLADPEFIH